MKRKQMLERAYADLVPKLTNWAREKFRSQEDTEDFCQEVMSRFAKMLTTKEAEGDEIVDIDKYLWSIAYNLLKDYYKDKQRKGKLVKGLENELLVGTQFVPSETDFATDTINGVPTEDTNLKKLRKSITSLDYNLREAMIMYYLEKKSLIEISLKLGVTEIYVKKLLAEAKSKIRENDKKGLYQVDKVYRPNSVEMGIVGDIKNSHSHQMILDSLSKQSICLACYEQARSVEELSLELGIPSAYLEYDVQKLLKAGFLKKLRNRYSTMFFIDDCTFQTRLINIYGKHKEKCLDKILDDLTALDSKLKAIGFYGCEKPINQLLWMLIYIFMIKAAELTYCFVHGRNFEILNKATGEHHFKKGTFFLEPKIPLEPEMVKYRDIFKWESNGPLINEGEPDGFNWFWLIKCDEYLYKSDHHARQSAIRVFQYIDFLSKVCKPDFRLDGLTDDEKSLLDKCVEIGFLSVVGAGTDTINGVPTADGINAVPTKTGADGINAVPTVVPHFYVFTPAQRKAFDKLLEECFEGVKNEMRELYLELCKMCKEFIPKQLDGYQDFISLNCMGSLCFYLVCFAYYDGRLFVPEGTDEYTLLTMNTTINYEL